MATIGTVHIGDIGTTFKAEIKDANLPFDPSSAVTKSLIFSSPNDEVFTKDATVTTSGTGAKQRWYLVYSVTTDDVDDGLNMLEGTWKWQGLVTFDDDSSYHTTIEEYEVMPNLDDV